MSNVLDNQEKKNRENAIKGFINIIVYLYAGILTLILIALLSGIKVKTSPTPLVAEEVSEIQESYSMLAGICINVGECGNDQVVIGLEKNRISQQVYTFLVWKSTEAE